MSGTLDAKVVELAIDSRAVIDQRGDVTFLRGGQALTLRRREIDKFIGAYQRAGHATTNGGKH